MKEKTGNVTGRTLHYYWQATRKHLFFFILGVVTTLGFSFFLSFANPYIVGKIVDKVAQGPSSAEHVLEDFFPFIMMLAASNLLGQICSKAQDYSVWKLTILVYYDLSTQVFDTLSNQSMSFHNSRFGGALVSQTSKFTSAYSSLLETFIYAILPIAASAVFTVVILYPLVPVYVIILIILMIVYVLTVWMLFRRLQRIKRRITLLVNLFFR